MYVCVTGANKKGRDSVSQMVKAAMDRPSIAIVATGHVFCDLCQGAIPAFLPFFVVERHFSYAAAAGLILAANLASSIIQPLFGQFADHQSAPWLMPAGLLVAGIGLALASTAPSYWLIALSVALSGVGIAAFHPEAARLINEASGERKATSMSIFSIGGNTGFALGPLVVTALLLALGLKSAALLLIPLIVMALVLVRAFRRFSVYESRGKAKNRWFSCACVATVNQASTLSAAASARLTRRVQYSQQVSNTLAPTRAPARVR